MIPLSTYALFLASCFAFVVVPGPNHLYITARAVSQGRPAGLASALGVETGTLLHIAAAAAGLSYLVARSMVLFNVVKWAGVGYLCYLGVRALLRRHEAEERVAAEPSQPLSAVFFEGVVVNVLNPKVILFFLAFLPQFVDPAAGAVPAQTVVLGLTLFTVGLTVDTVYAVGAGAVGARLRGRARLLGRVSGVVYLALGVVTAFGSARPS
ncbi:RhtB family transporter [Microtetraspora sp. NBRC 13810]|uniref:LysE family translocator n=1 Tax=Microtetraspora sp. NBRC 13810 TaxID=3030990 RepID=UPI0024A146F7|nr:LysE family translocator [Microtetraspora sp. NBRC 13810]GLW05241.1 RhtB family transporter [Microtetraspora sp. NBRC 13810]